MTMQSDPGDECTCERCSRGPAGERLIHAAWQARQIARGEPVQSEHHFPLTDAEAEE